VSESTEPKALNLQETEAQLQSALFELSKATHNRMLYEEREAFLFQETKRLMAQANDLRGKIAAEVKAASAPKPTLTVVDGGEVK
jgi:hypothetical protein